MLRSLTPALAALLALAATPTSAQTPTLDGAMRFMELALPGHSYGCSTACGYKSYKIQTATKVDACVMRLTGTSEYYPSVTVLIDFTRVTQVRDGGTAALVAFPGGEALLMVESTEFAARLIYAANFARLKCDRTASTGF